MAKKILGFVLVLSWIAFFYRDLLDGNYWWAKGASDTLWPIRVMEMEKCFRDGQLPCRWSANLGGGYGLPLFNYYPPFFYLLTLGPRLLGWSIVWSVKIVLLSLLVFSFISLKRGLREFFSWQTAWLGATLFLSLPFLAVELFVRGDLAELTAILLAPAVFYWLYLGIRKNTWLNWMMGVVLLATFWLSHNVQTVIFTPLLIIWAGYWAIRQRKIKQTLLALALAFGLAAFFLLPAWLEKDLVQIQLLTRDYFDFHNHFIGLRQLFWEREWRYGVSNFDQVNEMSFQLGWPHWWLVFLSLLVWRRDKKALWFWLAWLVSLFLMTNRSVWLWEKIPLMAYFQFPWRFLGVACLLTIILGSWGFERLTTKLKTSFLVAVALLSLVLNFSYFKAKERLVLADEQIETGYLRENWWGSVKDYLPKTVGFLPETARGNDGLYRKSDYWELKVENYAQEPNRVVIPIFAFPDWLVFADQKPIDYQINENGLIEVSVNEGKQEITGWFQNTPIRRLANGISLATTLLFLVVAIKKK